MNLISPNILKKFFHLELSSRWCLQKEVYCVYVFSVCCMCLQRVVSIPVAAHITFSPKLTSEVGVTSVSRRKKCKLWKAQKIVQSDSAVERSSRRAPWSLALEADSDLVTPPFSGSGESHSSSVASHLCKIEDNLMIFFVAFG